MAPARKFTVTILSNAKDQSASRLLALCPELRNRIYDYIFEDQTVTLKAKSKYNTEGRSRVPGILMSCKQIYAESLQIFFNKSIFLFTNMTKLTGWLNNIGPFNRSVVAHIDFRVPFKAVGTFLNGLTPDDDAILLKLGGVLMEIMRRGMFLVTPRLRVVSPIVDAEAVYWGALDEEEVSVKVVQGDWLEMVKERD